MTRSTTRRVLAAAVGAVLSILIAGSAAADPPLPRESAAGWLARLAGGRPLAGLRAHQFLHSLQVGCPGPAADRGAIAFAAGEFDPATAIRATAQGILGLVGVGFSRLDASGSAAGAPTLSCP